jgi:tetratricopeptide (TPR) repeat protein
MLSLPLWAQQPAPSSPQPRPPSPDAQPQEQEPPEEDQSFKPRTYDFNPLQATKSVEAGDFYFKKGNLAAAKGRYRDATLYDPGSALAFEKLGEVSEKLRDFAGARDAYSKYLELAPTAKDVEAVKKRMEKFPAPRK